MAHEKDTDGRVETPTEGVSSTDHSSTYQIFSLNSFEEVQKFEALLDSYGSARSQGSPKHIRLVDAYSKLQSRSDGGRIFTALLDIQINFLLLSLDMTEVGGRWNASFAKGKLEGGSVLDSAQKFFGKMDIHRFTSSYVLRYRALWDKLMGLMILLNAPNEYDAFSSAKSKKRAFAKIAGKHDLATPELVTTLTELLERFDRTFRTPEAHGSGVLRKYTFSMESMADNPQVQLIGFWNAMNAFIAELGKMLGKDQST